MLAGMLPDIDLLLSIFGIPHRTLTHSIIFWSVLFVPFFVKYRMAAIPYFVAVGSHIFFGDLIVGRTAFLWPWTEFVSGMGLSPFSPINLVLEAIGLVLFGVVFAKDKNRTKSATWLQLIALLPIAAFAVMGSVGNVAAPLLLEGSDAEYLARNLPSLVNNRAMQIVVGLHVALAGILSVNLLSSLGVRVR
jgi:hypothetical protein